MSPIIRIEPPTAEAWKLWARTLELAAKFESEESWTLVGGLMVQLHAFERDQDSRLTMDVDFLGDSRRRPAATARMVEVLTELGAEMALPPRGSERLGYRFEIDGSVIEILGSEGMKRDPNTLGTYTTIQIPGGTQALRRSESIPVSLGRAEPVAVRRPNLLGAILIKARALARRRSGKIESDRQDLIRLLGFVDDPRAMAADLRRSERKWLRRIEPLLAFEESDLKRLFSAEEMAGAEAAYRLLLAPEGNAV